MPTVGVKKFLVFVCLLLCASACGRASETIALPATNASAPTTTTPLPSTEPDEERN
tara:strand:+ start:213 stop:380 length:168 start_codon:yes stop_codon:yes gene_type:complete